jgi:hypothetical protein
MALEACSLPSLPSQRWHTAGGTDMGCVVRARAWGAPLRYAVMVVHF